MLIVGISGKTLTPAERSGLCDPRVSGVILFTRNFVDRQQVSALAEDIRDTREKPLLVCVDQEGGPVQRFREGYTPLPALARLGGLYDRDRKRAVALAEEHAWLMASELRATGIDLSFAPVVDLKRGNRAIGERAFHPDPEAVSELSLAYLRGMRLAGMAVTIKHFPGHGSIAADTHLECAVDARPLAALEALDLRPFADAIRAGAEAVMMAHVTYPAVAPEPAGYSPRWIRDILRKELDFQGAVFSDDIGMAAAEAAGGVCARIDAHLDAGCDFVLVCQPELVPDALAAVVSREPTPDEAIAALQGCVGNSWEALTDNPQRDAFIARVASL